MRNVSRAWAFETGLAAGVELGEGELKFAPIRCCSHSYTEIPVNEYYEYFGPDYKLDVKSSNMEDLNSQRYLDRVLGIVSENLRSLGGPPSVQMQGEPLFIDAT
jgi:histone deacetylase 1/2